MVGMLPAGVLVAKLGRRFSIISSGLFLAAGWLIVSLSAEFWLICIGRCVQKYIQKVKKNYILDVCKGYISCLWTFTYLLPKQAGIKQPQLAVTTLVKHIRGPRVDERLPYFHFPSLSSINTRKHIGMYSMDLFVLLSTLKRKNNNKFGRKEKWTVRCRLLS